MRSEVDLIDLHSLEPDYQLSARDVDADIRVKKNHVKIDCNDEEGTPEMSITKQPEN